MTVESLGIAIGAVILIALAAIAIGALRHKPPRPHAGRHEEPKRHDYDCTELLEIRILEGVEASGRYAHAFENHVIGELADFDDLDKRDEKIARRDFLRRQSAFLARYVEEYAGRAHAPSATVTWSVEAAQAFFHDIASLGDLAPGGIPLLYPSLLSLHEKLDLENFPVLVQYLADLEPESHLAEGNDPQMQSIYAGFAQLATVARDCHDAGSLSDDRKDRQRATNDVRRAIENVRESACGGARAPDQQADMSSPESTYFCELTKRALKIVRDEQSRVADKPTFEVALWEVGDKIQVEGELLPLQFEVRNTTHKTVPLKREIRICPVSKSPELVYGGEWKTADLTRGGTDILDFTFQAYYLDRTDFDPRPELEFRISCPFREGRLESTIHLRLPEIEPVFHITNPFEEGKAGTGLAGNSPLFVGRSELLREISSNLLNFQAKPIFYLIHGLPRSGKTSVLNRFADNPTWHKDKYVVVRASAQVSQNIPTYFAELYEQVREALISLDIHIRNPDRKTLQEARAPAWEAVVDLVRLNEKALAERKKRILLVVDEYQTLATWDDRIPGHDQIDARFQFPEFIKVLRDQYDRSVVVMMAGYQTLREVAEYNYYWIEQLGGRLLSKPVTNLTEKETANLIRRNFKRHNIDVPDPSMARIGRYTGRHPYLLVTVGYNLFERFVDREKNVVPGGQRVTDADIDEAVREVALEELKFLWSDRWIRGGNEEETTLLLAAIADITYARASEAGDLSVAPPVSIDAVREHLFNRHDIDHHEYSYNDSPPRLTNAGVVSACDRPNEYKLMYPMFAVLAHRYDFLRLAIKRAKESSPGAS